MKTTNLWERLCPDEGQWMAFFDGEGRPEDRERLGAHLRQCVSCQQIFDEIGQTVWVADGALDAVHTVARPRRVASAWWPAAAAAAILVGLGAGFQTAGHGALAAVGSLFQVKSIGTVGVSPTELSALSRTLSQGGRVTLAHYGSIKVSGPVKDETVQASNLKSFNMPNVWPKAWGAAPAAQVQTGMRVTLRLNVPHINQLIQIEGGHDFFPMSLNNRPFTVVVPAEATLTHGNWKIQEVPQPTVAVPGQVPVKEVARALENLPFMPTSLKDAVARMSNWKDTLIVPLPGHPQNLQVSGTQRIADENQSGTVAGEAWIQNGVAVLVTEHQHQPISMSQFEAQVSQLLP
ncbi:hypothetical protein [Sulfobacillus harzensis]|uniref:Zinc-finger domain-containing protein n=1 Tax=Sulfobacillus harzensis TaxID=2729629 RepID=A0A7Y0L402_9FIRM|nr:hypothetical protein [Sulfobacillus harzensis]NMP22919.1 hypothetical protein [Sulfobacillus harzensis]